jgi:hypothetical protein
MKKYFAIAVFSALLLPSIAAASSGTVKSGTINNHVYIPSNSRRTFQFCDSTSNGHVVGQATDMLFVGQLASGLIGVAGFLSLRRRSGEAK